MGELPEEQVAACRVAWPTGQCVLPRLIASSIPTFGAVQPPATSTCVKVERAAQGGHLVVDFQGNRSATVAIEVIDSAEGFRGQGVVQ